MIYESVNLKGVVYCTTNRIVWTGLKAILGGNFEGSMENKVLKHCSERDYRSYNTHCYLFLEKFHVADFYQNRLPKRVSTINKKLESQ